MNQKDTYLKSFYSFLHNSDQSKELPNFWHLTMRQTHTNATQSIDLPKFLQTSFICCWEIVPRIPPKSLESSIPTHCLLSVHFTNTTQPYTPSAPLEMQFLSEYANKLLERTDEVTTSKKTRTVRLEGTFRVINVKVTARLINKFLYLPF